MVYRFIDNIKDIKGEYHEQREAIYERIKYIYYNNHQTVGHRAMRVFLLCNKNDAIENGPALADPHLCHTCPLY